MTGEAREKLRAALDAKQVHEVGGCEPCREMKWLGWRVVQWDGTLYALVTDTDGDWEGTAHQIDEDELHLYTEY